MKETRNCQGCNKDLPLDHFDPNKKLTRCLKCVEKYLKRDNLLWYQYPEIADVVDTKFKEEHPKLTVASKMEIPIPCPICQSIFTISVCDFLKTGFTPCCKQYLISLDKKQLKNATIDAILESKSFEEYVEKISVFKPIELGFIQEVFAFLYFNIHANLFDMEQYVSYSLTKNKLILEDLNLPPTDLGTDAVIIHKDGDISLVQVKWRGDQVNQNRSAFAGMAIDSQTTNATIKHLILFSNSVNIAKNLPIGPKFKYILYNNLLNIDWEFFKGSVENYKETKELVPIVQPIVYRPWQIEANKFVKDKDIATIVAACGAGKTLCAYKIISKWSSFKILIIVPSLQLLSQWFYQFATRCGQDTEFLLVGSDHDSEEVDVPYTLTTNPKVVKKIMKNSEEKFVTICTYQSLDIVYDCKFEFDLTFVDEAHLTTGTKKSNFTLIHKENFTTQRKIFLTATPKIFKGIKKESCVSMDDETKYGEQFVYSCRQAIDDNFVTKYGVILGLARGLFSEDDRYMKYAYLLKKSIEDYGLERILVASNTHASSAKLYNCFKEIYRGSLELVLMKKNAGAQDKNKVLANIITSPMVIFNVKVFSLGTDIPSLQAVFFNGDKGSPIDIVQTAMRCMRKYPEKEKAYIIVPSFLNEGEEGLDDFPNIRNILSALSSQDKVLYEEVVLRAKCAKTGKKYKGSSQIVEYIDMNEEDVEEANFNEIQTILFDKFGKVSKINQSIIWKIVFEEIKVNKNWISVKFIKYGINLGSFQNSIKCAITGSINGYKEILPDIMNDLKSLSFYDKLMKSLNEIIEKRKINKPNSQEKWKMLMKEYIIHKTWVPYDFVKNGVKLGSFQNHIKGAITNNTNRFKKELPNWMAQLKKYPFYVEMMKQLEDIKEKRKIKKPNSQEMWKMLMKEYIIRKTWVPHNYVKNGIKLGEFQGRIKAAIIGLNNYYKKELPNWITDLEKYSFHEEMIEQLNEIKEKITPQEKWNMLKEEYVIRKTWVPTKFVKNGIRLGRFQTRIKGAIIGSTNAFKKELPDWITDLKQYPFYTEMIKQLEDKKK